MNVMPLDMAKVSRLLGSPVTASRPIVGRGYTNNRRWVAELASGTSVFVKQAADETTADWLRREHQVYQSLSGDFMPRVIAFSNDELPLLVLEDLSDATWPPPWELHTVKAVLRGLAELAAHPPVPGLGSFTDRYKMGSWSEVAADPGPFLSLGMCSPAWLDRALPVLLEAAEGVRLTGDNVVHLDVRSDNLCVRGDRVVLVDWNLAACGSAEVDLAFWLPSLHAEGGPPPEEVASIDPALVAFVAGFFAARAGLPEIPTAPHVRRVQRAQLAVALPWAIRVLRLDEP